MEKKERGFIIFIFLLITLSFVSAELIITPDTLNVDLIVGENKSYELTLNNTFNFLIKDITFSNLDGFSIPSITLNPYEVKKVNISVIKTATDQRQINSLITFRYLIEGQQNPVTKFVNVTELDYNPSFIEIRQDDSITWYNSDDISHTVTSGSFGDHHLNSGESYTRQFTDIGTYTYMDLTMYYSGTLSVINKSLPQTAHNPDYDKHLIVNMNAIYDPTNLDVNTLLKTFTVNVADSTEDLIRITNNGSTIADRIYLSSDKSWISFKENNFSLNSGTTKYVAYSILPLVSNTSETNKTYSITISVKASNSQIYTQIISVTVPYSEIVEGLGSSDIGTINWLNKVFCPSHPTSFLCNQSANIVIQEKIVYRDPEIPLNMTQRQVQGLLERITKIEDSNARTDNQIKILADSLGLTIPELRDLLNQSLAKQTENEDKYDSNMDAYWIIIVGIIISVCIFLVSYYSHKYRNTKDKGSGL